MDRPQGPNPGEQRPGDDRRTVVEALVSAQRWEAALRSLSPALAADPDDPRLLALLVRTLRALGRREDALDASRRLLTLAPEDPYSYRLATLVLVDVGWVDEAIGVATRAVALDPHNAANHLALSRAWAQSRRPGAVAHQLAAAREAVLLDPNSPDAQIQIGAALAADADVEGARAAYRAALRLDPGNAAALNNLAVLDLQAGDAESAARGLAAALAADPQGAVARRNLDAVAVRVLRRIGWWTLVAPVPALLAALLDRTALARVLAAAVLAVLPLAGLRFWRALSPGQRRTLRELPRRLRLGSWAWPTMSAVLGGSALVVCMAVPRVVSTRVAGGYAALALTLALFRLVAAAARPSWRAEVAARAARVRSGARRR